jgi:HEAT repeat protein
MGLKKPRDSAELRSIADRDYPRGPDGLIAQLDDPDIATRRWAARDLAAHPQAVPRLCVQLLTERDASVRVALFTSIGRVGGPDAVDGILPLLRSEDAALRNGAIETLAGLPDAVAPRIQALLQDEDVDVRIFTVNLLGDLAHPRVTQWLAQVLRGESQANVIGAALEVLAEVGGPDMLEPLREVRKRFAGDPYIAFTTDLVIERIDTR